MLPFISTTLFRILALEKLPPRTFGHFVKTAIGAKATIPNCTIRANNKTMNRSTLASWFLNVVRFGEGVSFINTLIRWAARPVILTVRFA